MDLSEYVKRGLKDLHKPKITNLVNQNKEQRQRNRNELMLAKRRIQNSPMPASPNVPRKLTRKEQMQKWKEERDKCKAEEKAKKKPVFITVCRTERKPCIEPQEHFQIAKAKHNFKAPSNIKPIQFNKGSADANKSDDTKEKRVTRSQTKLMADAKSTATSAKSQVPIPKNTRKAPEESIARSKPNQRSKSVNLPPAKPDQKIPHKKSNDEKIPNNRRIAASSVSDVDTLVQTFEQTMKGDARPVKTPRRTICCEIVTQMSPMQSKKITEENGSTSVEKTVLSDNVFTPSAPKTGSNTVTPNNGQKPVAYISPFVTMSRGKRNARKEFEARHLQGGQSVISPEATGTQAGAAYFSRLLDTEIGKIEAKCCEWNSYKEENDLPEEACDMINVATGQSGLLIAKRMQQFRGLINSCAAQNTDPLITCLDLHGFWDVVYIQVTNLEERFANLERLKANNWEEVIPEKKKTVTRVAKKKRSPAKPVAKQGSKIRDAIRAARLKAKGGSVLAVGETDENVVEGRFSRVQSPRKGGNTPMNSRQSLLKTVLENRLTLSPGLAMIRATRTARSIGHEGELSSKTPSKSILKSEGSKSSSVNLSKTVFFADEPISAKVDATVDAIQPEDQTVSNENDLNVSNTNNSPIKAVPRRSSRLSRRNLFP